MFNYLSVGLSSSGSFVTREPSVDLDLIVGSILSYRRFVDQPALVSRWE